MAFFRLTRKASRLTDSSLTGSNSTPIVYDSDFSGARVGLPPVMVMNWKLQSPGAPVLTSGQRIGSRVPLAVTLVACEVYRSVSDGARKPVPTDERSRNVPVGCQRIDAFGLTVSPTPW
jgi:hypothetical protein